MTHSDRRRTQRFVPASKAHITVMAGGDMLPARLTNISTEGVAAVYAHGRIPCCNTRVQVDILANASAGLLVTGLRCRTVYDHLTLSEGGSYSGISARQCGLEFIDPSTSQNAQLQRLLSRLRGSIAKGR